MGVLDNLRQRLSGMFDGGKTPETSEEDRLFAEADQKIAAQAGRVAARDLHELGERFDVQPPTTLQRRIESDIAEQPFRDDLAAHLDGDELDEPEF